MPRFQLAALVAGALFASPTFAESIDNPVYKSWAGQKKGTVVTVKMVSDFGGQKSESTMVTTLTELTADAATIETVTATKVGTMEFKAPAMKLEVKKTVELPAGKKKEDFDKPEGFLEGGTETVKVDGVVYKTKWMKMKTKMNDVELDAKTWTSDDVPNMVVKMDTKTNIKGMGGSMTMELVSVKKP